MKNIINEPPVENVGAVSQPSLRRRFITLIAVLVALSLLTAAFAVFTFVDFSDDGNDGNTPTGSTSFDYFSALLADYIALTRDKVTGLTLPGFESRVDEVTEDSVKAYINKILLSSVALTSEDLADPSSYASAAKWSQAIDYADEVFLYITRVETADGTRVGEGHFENAYMEAGRLQIGMEYFGKEFDDRLIGLVPKDTGYFETRTKGDVASDDVIILTYTATETIKATEEGKADTVKNHKNYTGIRMDLSEVKDAAWRDALLAAYGTVGQYFSFEYEEDIDGDGDKETVKYEGMIDAVVENEAPYALTATLPENYFGVNPTEEELAALNGATLTFYINISYIVPHEANTFETMDLADIRTVQSFLDAQGFLPFVPSNDKGQNGGELTELGNSISSYETSIEKLKGEIATIHYQGDIVRLEGEIAAIEAEIAELEASGEDKTAEIAQKNATLNLKQKALNSKKETLATKESALAKAEANLAEAEPKLETAVDKAREECLAFIKGELEDSYEDSVKLAAGGVVYEYLLENLDFLKLPESEVSGWTTYFKDAIKGYYEELTAAEKRNYKDLDDYAATLIATYPVAPFMSLPTVYVDYDAKNYAGYEDGVAQCLVPYVIKYQLLVPAIYNALINDGAKLDAEVEKYIKDTLEYQEAIGEAMTRQQLLVAFEENYGKDYMNVLRNYYAMPLVVFDFLAENNTVDWNLKAN